MHSSDLTTLYLTVLALPTTNKVLQSLGTRRNFSSMEKTSGHTLSLFTCVLSCTLMSLLFTMTLCSAVERGNRFGSEDYSRNSHVTSKHLRNAVVESEAIQSLDDAVSVRHNCPHAVYPTHQVSCCLNIFVCCVRTCIKCHWKYHCLKKKNSVPASVGKARNVKCSSPYVNRTRNLILKEV